MHRSLCVICLVAGSVLGVASCVGGIAGSESGAGAGAGSSMDPGLTPEGPGGAGGSPGAAPAPGVAPGGMGGMGGSMAGAPADLGGAFTSVPDLGVAGKCSAATKRGAARDGIRRLTKRQLLRTLQAVFPSRFTYRTSSDPDSFYTPSKDFMASYPEDVTADATENFDPMHSEAQISGWIDIADDIGKWMATASAEKKRYAGQCLDTAPSPECWRAFITSLGRALWRRPLQPAEADTLVSQVPAGDTAIAVQTIVLRLLTAPPMLFLIEIGAANDGARVRLTDHDVAARLAYALTDAPPDAMLATAADAGQLKTVAALEPHALRLMTSIQGKARFKRFVSDWMQAEMIGDPIEDQAWYRENRKYNGWTGKGIGLGGAFKREIGDFFNHVVFGRKGTFRDLMTLKVGFPDDVRLAAIYGATVTTPDQPVTTPDHPGLLTRAGVLASTSNEPPTIHRGVAVKRRILCDVLPSPDFSVIGSRLQMLNALDPRKVSNADMVKMVTAPEACMSCHSQINPIGFALETYSPIAIREESQNYIWNDGSTGPRLWATFPLPGPQTVNVSGKTLAVNKPEDLTTALGDSANARACMVVRFFRTVVAKPEEAADACALSEPIALLDRDAPLLDALTRAVVNEDIFWRRAQ